MNSNELENFLSRIRQAYVDARKPVCSQTVCEDFIERGRSRTISGIAEDYFAELLYNELKKYELHFFVDQPLNYGIKKIVYPDVMITRCIEDKFQILCMLDLKMDVGYHRIGGKNDNYVKKADALLNDIEKLRNTSSDITSTSGSKKGTKYHFSLHPQASYDEVIITSKNSGDEQKLIEFAEDSEKNIWVLSKGDHPNKYTNELNMCPFYTNWELLLQKILKIVND